MEPQNWTGEERRSIPIHVLNYVDTRLQEHADHMEGKIDALHQEFFHMAQSLNSWMEKQPLYIMSECEKLIDESLPVSPDNPDAKPAEKRKEHRVAHARWIKKVMDEMEKWERVRQKLIEWAILGAAGFVAIAIWRMVLEGPK